MNKVKYIWDQRPIRFGNRLAKNLRFNLLSFFLLLSFQTGAQQIIWEKYWPNIKGEFDEVVQGDSGFYFGVGNLEVIHHYTLAAPFRDTLVGVIVVKMNQDGDTVWCKKVADNPGNKPTTWIKANDNGTLTVVYRTGAWVSEYRLINMAQSTGANFALTTIPETYWYAKDFGTDMEGNIYILGQREKFGIPNQYEMVCVKVNADGSIGYINGYSPNNFPTSAAQYIEPMPGGKMRMSGNKGKTIVAYELNADGSVADYKEYLDNPYNYVQQDGAYVQQSDSGHFLVSVRKWSGLANYKFGVAKMDGQQNTVWSYRKPGIFDFPFPTLDGGFVGQRFSDQFNEIYLERIGNDSSIIWSLDINQNSTVPGRKGGKLMYLGDNNGLIYGAVVPAQGGNLIAYLCMVGNVGYPVDPTNPIPPVLGTKEERRKTTVSYAVPNPTTGIFHVLGMGSGHFRMVDAQGRTVMEAEHKGGDAIDVSGLPCGVYTYTLVTKGSRTEGRVVRE
jgi:hypothetical protein